MHAHDEALAGGRHDAVPRLFIIDRTSPGG
jgi:hypothetical protein